MSVIEKFIEEIEVIFIELIPNEQDWSNSNLYLDYMFPKICILAKQGKPKELVEICQEVMKNWLAKNKIEDSIDLVILLNMMIFAGDPTQVDSETMVKLNEFYQRRFTDDSPEGKIKLHYTTLAMVSNLYEILKAMQI